MELFLNRFYLPIGTVGRIETEKKSFICYTIEEIWNDNKKGISCIPKGRYEIVKDMSPKFGECMLVKNTAPRERILIHKGNTILHTEGCILPCTSISITKEKVVGIDSTNSFNILKKLIYEAIDKGERVFLNIN